MMMVIITMMTTTATMDMMTSSKNIFRVTGQWRGALMFSFICARINGWVNNGDAGDLRRHRAHYDITVMVIMGALLLIETLIVITMGMLLCLRMWPSFYFPQYSCHQPCQYHVQRDTRGIEAYKFRCLNHREVLRGWCQHIPLWRGYDAK